MGVTGSSDAVMIVSLSAHAFEADYNEPVSYGDLAGVLHTMAPVDAAEFVDIDPRGDDPFAF